MFCVYLKISHLFSFSLCVIYCLCFEIAFRFDKFVAGVCIFTAHQWGRTCVTKLLAPQSKTTLDSCGDYLTFLNTTIGVISRNDFLTRDPLVEEMLLVPKLGSHFRFSKCLYIYFFHVIYFRRLGTQNEVNNTIPSPGRTPLSKSKVEDNTNVVS